jgi:predicted membrane-bound spermidine synthase
LVKARSTSILLACSGLTGFSALLYETVWQRVLGFFSGSDVVSATLVVSAYLSGLALGSFISSVFVDRIREERLVYWYSGLTCAIGVFACLSTPLFYGFVYQRLGALALSVGWTYAVLFLALMTPTALMGASFPVIGRLLCENRVSNTVERLALLNGVNIFGAVLGSLLSGWYLIGSLGYDRTTYVGAAIDVGAGLLALALGPRPRPSLDAAVAEGRAVAVPPAQLLSALHFTREVREWAALTFLSGFIAISLEVVWLRLLSIYIKSNSYLFAHLVAFILLGFSLGSMWGMRLMRRVSDAKEVFLWAQVGIVVYVLGSNLLIAFFYPRISGWLGTGLFVLDPGHGWTAVATDLGRYVGVPLFVLFPPTILIGLTFPCAQKAIQDDPSLVGARVGLVQTANLIGNISGGLVTGLFLLDRIGSFAILRLLGIMGMVFASFLLMKRATPARRFRGAMAALGLFALVALYPNSRTLVGWIHDVVPGQPFVFSEDSSGIAALVGIPPGYNASILNVDGFAESVVPFDKFHIYIGVAGALLHPNPESIFVVGVGSGGTPYNIGVHPGTHRIRAVEIISSELKVLEQLKGTSAGKAVDRFMADPRYEIVAADARKYLTSSNEKYDIIEADAARPKRPHSGLIYSVEFFELVRTRLKPGGLFVQWQASPRVKSTMLRVFPYVVAFDQILLGSNSPIRLDKQAMVAQLNDQRIRRYLEAVNVNIDYIRERFANAGFEQWTPSDARGILDVNTDLRPRDEFYMNNRDGLAPVKSQSLYATPEDSRVARALRRCSTPM